MKGLMKEIFAEFSLFVIRLDFALILSSNLWLKIYLPICHSKSIASNVLLIVPMYAKLNILLEHFRNVVMDIVIFCQIL